MISTDKWYGFIYCVSNALHCRRTHYEVIVSGSVTMTTEGCYARCDNIGSYEFLWIRRTWTIFRPSWMFTILCCLVIGLALGLGLGLGWLVSGYAHGLFYFTAKFEYFYYCEFCVCLREVNDLSYPFCSWCLYYLLLSLLCFNMSNCCNMSRWINIVSHRCRLTALWRRIDLTRIRTHHPPHCMSVV